MNCVISVLQFVYTRHFFMGILCGYLIATAIFRFELNLQLKDLNTDLLFKFVRNSIAPGTELAIRRDRILCWVVTTPSNTLKAEAVKNTWGQRCDKLLFMSSQNDSSLPTIGLPLPGPESRDQLWNKAKLTLRYIYQNHINDYDWFFKADDDTYAVMDNLRILLNSHDPSQPLFLGHQFGFGNHSFLSGGAGYILTRETLRRLVEQGLDQGKCPTSFKGQEDDVTITQCLRNVGVQIPSTEDNSKHERFLSFEIEKFYSRNSSRVQCVGDVQPQHCLSDRAITFHYVTSNRMFLYDYLIYRLKANVTNNS